MNYLTLSNLQVYQLSRQLSKKAWVVYKRFNWQLKKIIGDQFIRAIDSIGANIAEGYGRYHYLDKIKFYYNARASHYEAVAHWLGLLYERNLISKSDYVAILQISSELAPRLNKFINSTYKAKLNSQITNYKLQISIIMIRFKRLFKSFKYALRGFIKTLKEEQNLKVQSTAGILVLIMAWYFGVSRIEWVLLIFVIGLVILMEIANSAVERIADVLKPRINTYVKEIKDITAAAVLLSSIISVIVGLIIFWPYIFR